MQKGSTASALSASPTPLLASNDLIVSRVELMRPRHIEKGFRAVRPSSYSLVTIRGLTLAILESSYESNRGACAGMRDRESYARMAFQNPGNDISTHSASQIVTPGIRSPAIPKAIAMRWSPKLWRAAPAKSFFVW